jgi:hypothetical protein
METLHLSSSSSVEPHARTDHWLAHAGFGLFVAGLMVCLVALYLGGPVDF